MDVTSVRQMLIELETQGWDALCDGTAADFYGRVMTEDGLMVLASGLVLDRNAVRDSLRQSPPWQSYSIDDPRMIPTGDDSAILVYIGTARRDDEPPFTAVMTSTYVRRGDDWRLVLYQQTPSDDG